MMNQQNGKKRFKNTILIEKRCVEEAHSDRASQGKGSCKYKIVKKIIKN